MTACIRRGHSVWTACACDDCQAKTYRVKKMYRTGHLSDPRPMSDAAWRHLDSLLDAGWSPLAIASAAGITSRFIRAALDYRAKTGHLQAFGRVRSAEILSVDPRQIPDAGELGARGAMRRLQALAVNGYSVEQCAEMTGLPRMTVYAIRRGDTQQVRVDVYRKVHQLYADLSSSTGPATIAAARARARGWSPPAAWDDIDTDAGPAVIATPATMTQAERFAAERARLVEDVEHLARSGCTIDAVRVRLGVKLDSLERNLRRANRADLLDLMRRNEPTWVDPALHITYDEGRRIAAHGERAA